MTATQARSARFDKLARERDQLRKAVQLAAAVLDSFLNGQGTATTEEIDEALTACHAALRASL